MYIPKINLATNKTEIVAFMQRFSFATIITAKNNLPVATHLPFLVKMQGDEITLTSHFAKANGQWEDIENNKVLVIFNEPHAYISTINYDKELNVPTWNYISVHAYGQGKLITEMEKVLEALENTINNYESAYMEKWRHFPMEYKTKMAKGIVAFEIVVTDLQGKDKLSQNRSVAEQQKIISTLEKSSDANERLIADYMQKNKTGSE